MATVVRNWYKEEEEEEVMAADLTAWIVIEIGPLK